MKTRTIQKNDIPDKWKVKKLGEIAKYINGRAFKPKEWSKSGLPIIRIQNLTESTNTINYFNGKYENRHFVKNGDILLAWSATLDIFEWNRSPALLNQHIFNVKVNEEIVHKKYFFYFIKYIIDKIKVRTHGTGMTHITKPMLLSIEILIPPMLAQQKIVKKLDAFFESYNILKEEKQKVKNNYSKIVFAYTNFLIKKALQNSWELMDLSEVAEIIMGQSPPGNSYNQNKEGLPLINGPTEFGEVHPTPIQWTRKPTKLCEKGDILICVRGSTTGRMNEADQRYCIGRGIAAVRPKQKISKEILYLMLENLTNEILSKSKGSTFPNIKQTELSALKIVVPPSSEQGIINKEIKRLKDIMKRINDSSNFNDSFIEQLPKSVLSKAFRGELVN